MRENRTYGSEGGAARVITGRAYPYQGSHRCLVVRWFVG